MGRTLSIDLASRSYRRFGICLVEGAGPPPWSATALEPASLDLRDPPDPSRCAAAVARFVEAAGVGVVLLDGPQGWKDPASDDPLCRACERELRCPARTGPPGTARPAPCLPFVEFSIALFTALARRWGMSLLTRRSRPAGVLLAESFPTAAWRSLGLPALPSKARATADDVARGAGFMGDLFGVRLPPGLTHDQLQAIAAGAAGPALADRTAGRWPPPGVRFAGRDPIPTAEGPVLEGLIALPASSWSET